MYTGRSFSALTSLPQIINVLLKNETVDYKENTKDKLSKL